MNYYSENDIREIVTGIIMSAGGGSGISCSTQPIPVESSARHVHLTAEAVKVLYGGNGELTKVRDLSQPGEFLAKERIKIVTAKGEFSNVAVLGPLRKAVQVEISATDSRALGINAPVNVSGDLEGAGDVILVGPNGMLLASGSAIVAKAHVHMTPEDAERYHVTNGQKVRLRLNTKRPLTIDDAVVRVNSNFALMVHVDLDEANAALVEKDTTASIEAV